MVFSAAILAASSLAFAAGAEISVSGQGEAAVVPDIAKIHFSITARADKSEEAARESARLHAEVVSALNAAGFSEKEIFTTLFRVEPEYQYSEQTRQRERKGYSSRQMLWVKTEDFSKIGNIIDAILTSGAAEINDIQYSSSRIDFMRKRALSDAIRRVREDAETLAREAGGSLGELIEISTPCQDGPGIIEAVRFGGAQVQAQQVPEEIIVRVSVSCRWRFVK